MYSILELKNAILNLKQRAIDNKNTLTLRIYLSTGKDRGKAED